MELKRLNTGRGAGKQHRINRTFMELKRLEHRASILYYRVLIEPLWN